MHQTDMNDAIIQRIYRSEPHLNGEGCQYFYQIDMGSNVTRQGMINLYSTNSL